MGQARGLIPTREWKRKAKGERWQIGETLNVGIGQGAVLTTPLQLAVMTARLANGGKAVKPRLVHSIDGIIEPVEFFPDIPINRRNLAIVLEGMTRVMEPGGVAYGSRLRGEGLSMAGKTGTAQIVRITQLQRDEGLEKLRERPWKERDHAIFVGFGPVEDPKYAVSVLVEHGGGGSRVAAPIARDVLRETLMKDPSNQLSAYLAPKNNLKSPGRD
jgi:penicillin-binding protein 2